MRRPGRACPGRTGRALIGPSEEPVELGPGDYLGYPGDVPHICEALDPGPTIILALENA